MSMIITTVHPEGIVMAADSAASIFKMVDMENFIKGNVAQAMANTANGTCAHVRGNVVGSKMITRSTHKLHAMMGNNIAITEGNQKGSNSLSLAPHINYFCQNNQYDNPKSCAMDLLNFIKSVAPNMGAVYHVCGYTTAGKIPLPEFWHVDVANNAVMVGCPAGQYGISFEGANEYFSQYVPLINKNIMTFSLQDIIDVSMFAFDMSIKLERFIDREEFISPPIDLLVVEPAGVKWVQQKTLKAGGV